MKAAVVDIGFVYRVGITAREQLQACLLIICSSVTEDKGPRVLECLYGDNRATEKTTAHCVAKHERHCR